MLTSAIPVETPSLPLTPTQATFPTSPDASPPVDLSRIAQDLQIGKLQEFAASMVNPEKELPSPVEVLAGAGQILAEQIAETADCRSAVRAVLWDTGKIVTKKNEKLGEHEGNDYKDYFKFEE